MMPERTYLDYNASAPLRPEAREAMRAALDMVGNASSVHLEGRKARSLIEDARRATADLVGADPLDVVFTSGATEAAQHTLTPHWLADGIARPAGRAYVSAIEHPVVLAGGRFAPDRVSRLPVDRHGRLDLAALEAALALHDAAAHGRPLVAVMAANNETGVMQPVREAAARVHAAGGYLVCDAVQLAPHAAIEIESLGVDAVLLSAHKLGGPAGCGAVVFRRDGPRPSRLLCGGGQEHGARAGTENLIGIVGLGAAATAVRTGGGSVAQLARLRDRLEAGVRRATPDAVVIGAGAERLPGTSAIAMPRRSADMLVIKLDLAGIAVSAGAACSSGKVAGSHVLEAMGLADELAGGAVRVSLGWASREGDVDRFLDAWSAIHARTAERNAA